MVRELALLCCMMLFAASAVPTYAQKANKKAARPQKVEKLSCMLGTEDLQARIAVELKGGKLHSFAYYSKRKPRTCSISLERDDAYSKWEDSGRFTSVRTEKGDFLIEDRRKDVHFLFRDVDRHFYCGMEEGKISGTLTLIRGKRECVLQGLMDVHQDQ